MSNSNSTYTLEFTEEDYRTRLIVFTTSNLKEPKYIVRDSILHVIEDKSIDRPYYLIDVFVKKGTFSDLKQITYYCIDIITEFLSQISVISYSPAYLVDLISTTRFKVTVGESFEMALYNGDFTKTPVDINLSDIQRYSHNSTVLKYVNLLIIVNDSLTTESLEVKFLNLFSVLDFIAQEETLEENVVICTNCGNKVNSHFATSKFLINLFAEHNVQRNVYNKIRKLRHQIAHASGIRNNDFYEDLRKYLPVLEPISIEEVSKRTNITVKRKNSTITDLPMLIVNAVKTSEVPKTFTVDDIKWTIRLAFTNIKTVNPDNNLPDAIEDFGPTGDPNSLEINSLAWPY